MAPFHADGSKIHLSVEITPHFLTWALLLNGHTTDTFAHMYDLAAS